MLIADSFTILGQEYKKSSVGMVVTICDLITVLIYLIALAYLKYMHKVDDKEINGQLQTSSLYSVEISPMPKHYQLIELKAELWNWIDDRINAIQRRDGQEKSNVVDIQFGLDNYDNILTLV